MFDPFKDVGYNSAFDIDPFKNTDDDAFDLFAVQDGVADELPENNHFSCAGCDKVFPLVLLVLLVFACSGSKLSFSTV